jgi:hypothetical protein
LKYIAEWEILESVIILSLSLQLFLTICVSIASWDWSFSKLNFTKNYFADHAILSIASDDKKDYDEVIDMFAALIRP